MNYFFNLSFSINGKNIKKQIVKKLDKNKNIRIKPPHF